MKKYNILTFSVHEAWESNLYKTGHNFYVLYSPERPHGWKASEREMPNNAVQIDFNSEKINEADIILCHSAFQQRSMAAAISNKINKPIIEMNHCLPLVIWGSSVINKLKQTSPAFKTVFHNVEQAYRWGYLSDFLVCGHAVDEDIFKKKYDGINESLISVAYDFVGRKDILGYDDWRVAANKFNVCHFGDCVVGRMATAKELASFHYINNRAFLNTAKESTMPTAMLEAMACGCPVVACKNGINEHYIKDGYNGYIYEDVFDMVKKCEILLKNHKKAVEIGDNGYYNLCENFSLSSFVNNWNEIFETTVGDWNDK